MTTASISRDRFERLERATDLPMAVLALLIVPALILEEHAQSAGVRSVAAAVNWAVWLAVPSTSARSSSRPRVETSCDGRGSIS